MFAAIDIGSNTLRLLITGPGKEKVYFRQITRLSGQFADGCLHQESMARTTAALKEFSQQIQQHDIDTYRAVATEAVRRANNKEEFLSLVYKETDLSIEVISGDEEAQLTTSGVLSVLDPLPANAIIIDIGGGSTELICVQNGITKFQHSYPLGVVRLCEELPSFELRAEYINNIVDDYRKQLSAKGLMGKTYQLIGTAGTVTTLAAISQSMTVYDPEQINNAAISSKWLSILLKQLLPLPIEEREKVPGMEAGRGDLIIPGIQILQSLSDKFNQPEIRVSDSGLLEGVIAGLLNNG